MCNFFWFVFMNHSSFQVPARTWGLIIEIVLEFGALEDKAAAKPVGGKSRRSPRNLGPGPGRAVYRPRNLRRVLPPLLFISSAVNQARACQSSGAIGVSGNGK